MATDEPNTALADLTEEECAEIILRQEDVDHLADAMDATAPSMIGSEERSRIIDVARQDYAANIADGAERVKIQAAIADRALQSLMIANGGALVALFTFVGNAHAMRFDGVRLKLAFGAFALGLFLTLIAHVFAFLSQDRFYNTAMLEAQRHQRIIASGEIDRDQDDAKRSHVFGHLHYAIGIGTFALATIAFITGCGLALWAVI